MISNEKYEKIIREGKRTDWYGVDVPEELITPLVKFASDGLSTEIHKLEGTLSDLRGTSLDKRKAYLKAIKHNLQNLPYSLNGDAYLKKKKLIEDSMEEELKKKKPVRKQRKTTNKTTNTRKTTSKKTTKNSDLIFGKNKK